MKFQDNHVSRQNIKESDPIWLLENVKSQDQFLTLPEICH